MKKNLFFILAVLILSCNIDESNQEEIIDPQPINIEDSDNPNDDSSENETNIDNKYNTVFKGKTSSEKDILKTRISEPTQLTAEEASNWNLGIGYNRQTRSEIGMGLDFSPEKTKIEDLNNSISAELKAFILEDKIDEWEMNKSDPTILFKDGSNYLPKDIGWKFKFDNNSIYMVVKYTYNSRILKILYYDYMQNFTDSFREKTLDQFVSYYGNNFLEGVQLGLNYEGIWEINSLKGLSNEKRISALKVEYSTVYKGIDLETALGNENITKEEYESFSIKCKSTKLMCDLELSSSIPFDGTVDSYSEFELLKERYSEYMKSNPGIVIRKFYSRYKNIFDLAGYSISESFTNSLDSYQTCYINMLKINDFVHKKISSGVFTQEDKDIKLDLFFTLDELEFSIISFDYSTGEHPTLDFSTIVPYIKYMEKHS